MASDWDKEEAVQTTNSRRWAVALTLLLVTAAATGCGYALVGKGSNIPADVRQIYIEPLTNRTPRSQVDQVLTRAIAEEMVNRRRFEVLASEDGADAVLRGEVLAFAVTPVSFDEQGRATEYEIVIRAGMRFARTDEDETVLWSNDQYVFRQSYAVELSDLEYIDREDLALEEAADRFAETMVSDLQEGF